MSKEIPLEVIDLANEELGILRAILDKLSSIEEKVARLDSFVLEVSPEEALHATQELEEELNAL
ncbi:hypothetical protein HN803_03080 [candidate division WWE3 bacterium]|jgi:hypothetical protein|nr:hypothetical protein [candidate division WWE3 bacterium]